ncbi:MAG: hypothetical protein OEQ90_04655 [Gammaproteobacteria bacterium]|nr:hypothetical protein [Gammaproteobacteria bacterium]
MRALRNTLLKYAAAGAAMLLCVTPASLAQDEDEQSEAEDESIDEVVVYARRSGDPVDLDALYQSQLRKRIMDDYMKQQRLREREEWRSSLSREIESPSRIRWGYDPAAELRMRRETDLMDLPFETERAATILRVEF